MVAQLGLAPSRIDILTSVSGVEFADAWDRRADGAYGTLNVPFLGREDLILNKRASGRMRDLGYLESLGSE